ncbi:MAG: hypothetical protein ACXVAK_10930 [Vulcanimicrobiaceae bacterium]
MLVFDPAGNLFVTNTISTNATEYAPPYTGAPVATISNGITEASGIAFEKDSYVLSIST